ncbi:hypothetical protein HK102_012480, partial [Quaeritorhiza haematococci]
MSSFVAPPIMASVLDPGKSFSQMSIDMEYRPHAVVHTAIGGDMSSQLSPNDPIFWLHHAVVDKFWYDWQSQPTNLQKFDGAAYNTQPSPSTLLQSFNIPVSSVLDSSSLCVTYAQPSSTARSLAADNPESLAHIRPPSIPEAWFNLRGANKTLGQRFLNETLREIENVTKRIEQGLKPPAPPVAPAVE